MRLPHLSDEQITSAISETGSLRGAADSLGVGRTTLRNAVVQRRLAVLPVRERHRSHPRLTRESLHRALEPPNNCRVKAFLEQIEDPGTREVIEEALGYSNSDFPAAALRRWLISEDYPDHVVPGEDAVKDHRAGRKPCRCR